MKHNQSVCACVWREAERLHTFSLVPTSGGPLGTRLSPGGCGYCSLCEMKLEGEWVGFAEGRGMNQENHGPPGKNTNFSKMEKNELAFGPMC